MQAKINENKTDNVTVENCRGFNWKDEYHQDNDNDNDADNDDDAATEVEGTAIEVVRLRWWEHRMERWLNRIKCGIFQKQTTARMESGIWNMVYGISIWPLEYLDSGICISFHFIEFCFGILDRVIDGSIQGSNQSSSEARTSFQRVWIVLLGHRFCPFFHR